MEGCAAPLHKWLPYFACGTYTGLRLSHMFVWTLFPKSVPQTRDTVCKFSVAPVSLVVSAGSCLQCMSSFYILVICSLRPPPHFPTTPPSVSGRCRAGGGLDATHSRRRLSARRMYSMRRQSRSRESFPRRCVGVPILLLLMGTPDARSQTQPHLCVDPERQNRFQRSRRQLVFTGTRCPPPERCRRERDRLHPDRHRRRRQRHPSPE